MKKRCAGLVVVLFSLFAFGVANAAFRFSGVVDPRAYVTRIDSVKLTLPDMTFLTPGWGSHTPLDSHDFAGVTCWPQTVTLHGTAGPFWFHRMVEHPDTTTWYALSVIGTSPLVKFYGTYFHAGVEESKPVVERLQCLAVSPSVVTGQMSVRLQPVGTSRPVVEIHDARGNVIRSLECVTVSGGAATATWNREDDRGHLVP